MINVTQTLLLSMSLKHFSKVPPCLQSLDMFEHFEGGAKLETHAREDDLLFKQGLTDVGGEPVGDEVVVDLPGGPTRHVGDGQVRLVVLPVVQERTCVGVQVGSEEGKETLRLYFQCPRNTLQKCLLVCSLLTCLNTFRAGPSLRPMPVRTSAL